MFFTSRACYSMRMVKSPRLLMMGQRKATSLVTAALLHKMESCPVFTLDLSTIYSESSRSPEEATVQVSKQKYLNKYSFNIQTSYSLHLNTLSLQSQLFTSSKLITLTESLFHSVESQYYCATRPISGIGSFVM